MSVKEYKSIVVETQCQSLEHVQFNSAFLLTLCLAHSKDRHLFIAEIKHLIAVKESLRRFRLTNISFKPISIPKRESRFRERLLQDFIISFGVLLNSLKLDAKRVIYLSTNSSILLTAKIIARIGWMASAHYYFVQHSVLESIVDLKKENYFLELVSYRSSLERLNNKKIKYILLGASIQRSLHQEMPGIIEYCIVFDHPYIFQDFENTKDPSKNLVFSFFGIGHKKKGLDIFLNLAKEAFNYTNNTLDYEFRCTGPLTLSYKGNCNLKYVKNINFSAAVPYDKYKEECELATYALFPYSKSSYRFYPSGAIFDAINLGKPIICIKNEYFNEIFHSCGDIGYLCNDEDSVENVIKELLDGFNYDYYSLQRENILKLKERYSPFHLKGQLYNILNKCESK
jgi:glycosyltransferase involved in cell wall biosynthesis